MSGPLATVAVPVRDRRERMLACLDALLAQDHPSFEVLVLDNGSTDGTAQACRERAAGAAIPVRVEVVPGTLGHVRNRAAQLARGRFLAYTDSDCTPSPTWLSTGVRVLEADPGLGVVCGVTLPDETPRAWARFVDVRELSWRFESCNIFFRTQALRGSEGFDEIVGDGWEDTAAGFAVLSHGWRAALAPGAVVHHDVTYPGYWWHLRREQRQGNLARVAGRYPELRRRLLFGRVFFSARSAACLAAFAGLSLGTRFPAARLLALPYAPFMLRRVRPDRMAQVALYDLAVHVALIRGALRHRRLVL
ncbi:MAG: glycosyltransferase family 2 protein [Actinobacteria bacterium]|nr:glycosyltransferase family 2 protein [Actinomycetota bacterium]